MAGHTTLRAHGDPLYDQTASRGCRDNDGKGKGSLRLDPAVASRGSMSSKAGRLALACDHLARERCVPQFIERRKRDAIGWFSEPGIGPRAAAASIWGSINECDRL